jgi:plastocyanin
MTKATTMKGVGLIAAATVLAGCGGSGGPGQPKPGQQPPVATIDVRETEFKLEPANPRIEKPGVVEFKVENAGQTVHALEVEGPEGEVETEAIQPGKSTTLRANLTEPGEYTWYCPVDGHKDRGMDGKITVGGG